VTGQPKKGDPLSSAGAMYDIWDESRGWRAFLSFLPPSDGQVQLRVIRVIHCFFVGVECKNSRCQIWAMAKSKLCGADIDKDDPLQELLARDVRVRSHVLDFLLRAEQ
jgi:hypothetical protein